MPMLSGLFRRPRNLIFLPPSAGCLFSNFRALLWRYRLSPLEATCLPMSDCYSIFPMLFGCRLQVFDLAAGDIDHQLGKLGRIAGALYPDMAFRHRDASDEE